MKAASAEGLRADRAPRAGDGELSLVFPGEWLWATPCILIQARENRDRSYFGQLRLPPRVCAGGTGGPAVGRCGLAVKAPLEPILDEQRHETVLVVDLFARDGDRPRGSRPLWSARMHCSSATTRRMRAWISIESIGSRPDKRHRRSRILAPARSTMRLARKHRSTSRAYRPKIGGGREPWMS